MIGGCQSSKISTAWRDESFRLESITKVFVVCNLKDDLLRRKAEDAFVRLLQRRGIDSIQSYRFYPETNPEKTEIAGKLKREGYSNVLIAKLLDEKTVTIDNLPACMTPNDWNRRGWYPAYNEACVGGKFIITVDTLRIETALFAADTDKLLWATQTQTELTANPTTEDIDQWVTLVIKNMFGK
jgi:hypothetical protein